MRGARDLILLASLSSAVPAYSQVDPQPPPITRPPSATQPPASEQPSGPQDVRTCGRRSVAGPERCSIQGDIDRLDGVNGDGLRYEDYRVAMQVGQSIAISAISAQIDPMIQVFEQRDGQPLAEDDDSGQGVNARLVFTAPRMGEYIIRVAGVFPQLRGPYTLTIGPARPLPAPIDTPGAPAGSTSWTEFVGELSTDDGDLDGLYFDDYQLHLAANAELFVRLDSDDFDAMVQVYRATTREGNFLQSDDDSGPGPNSLLLFTRPQAGDYIVRVTTFSARRPTGRYRLRIGRSM